EDEVEALAADREAQAVGAQHVDAHRPQALRGDRRVDVPLLRRDDARIDAWQDARQHLAAAGAEIEDRARAGGVLAGDLFVIPRHRRPQMAKLDARETPSGEVARPLDVGL